MRALGRAPRGGTLACSLALVALAAPPACVLNQEGVPPPRNRLAFPASGLVDPTTPRWLYVANSNSDLRYNNGTLVAVDLDAAKMDRDEPAAGQWAVCPYAEYIRPENDSSPVCCWDYLDHDVLDCDERPYIHAASTIELGSFASGMEFQKFAERDSCVTDPATGVPQGPRFDNPTNRHDCHVNCAADATAGRLFIGVRGNSSLSYVDTGGDHDMTNDGFPHFTCAGSPDNKSACKVTDVTRAVGAPPTLVPDEPYALKLDPANDLLYVGHLRGDVAHPSTGGVSLFDVKNGSARAAPTFIGPSQNLFGPDANGFFGITSLTLDPKGLYATSRYSTRAINVVTTLTTPSCTDLQKADDISVVGGSDVFTTPLPGAEIRGIQLLPDSNRAYLLQRVPPALVGFDTQAGPNGRYGNVPTDILETCSAPTFLQASTFPAKGSEPADTHLYVTCFEQGQVYVFDPYVPRLTNVIDVGRGPAGLVFSPPDTPPADRRAYVIGFSANNVSVVDLAPGSSTQYHVIQRIGFPSLVPR